MLTIDGSRGEGGGQIVRTALALSLVTRTPFRLEKLRAGRAKPGLLRQHLTAVRAAAEIGRARVEGAELGSRAIAFYPGELRHGAFRFNVGSAGSAILVLQTILPALLGAREPSELVLEGGTHNSKAPSFDFLERVFLPLLRRMGANVTAAIERHGFYPAGGGRIRAAVQPATLAPLHLLERGEIRDRRVTAVFAALPFDVARRELDTIRARLGWDEAWCHPHEVLDSAGPGNVAHIEIGSDHVTELFTGFGERGVRAEDVAEEVAREAAQYLAAGVPVGPHLADQLLLPMALAGGGSFVTLPPTEHTTTQIEIIRQFLRRTIRCEQLTADSTHIEVT